MIGGIELRVEYRGREQMLNWFYRWDVFDALLMGVAVIVLLRLRHRAQRRRRLAREYELDRLRTS